MFYVNAILVFVCMIGLTIGYSALSASVMVSGDLTYRADAEMRITGVSVLSSTDGASIAYVPIYQVATLNIGSNLTQLTSNIVYKVTVENKSSKYKTISAQVATSDSNTNIVYNITGDGYQIGSIIPPKTSVDLYFQFKYKSGVTTIPSETTDDTIIKLTYQDAKITASDLYYDNSKTGLNTDNVQGALDEIKKLLS